MIKKIAQKEQQSEDFILQGIRNNKICVMKSKLRDIEPVVIGEGTFTKVNANIGTSPEKDNLKHELQKLQIAEEAGADTVMDLSCGSNIDDTRKAVIEKALVPVGTVPVYQLMAENVKKNQNIKNISGKDFLDCVYKHGTQGVDFVTVHTGINREIIEVLKESPRKIPVVSRGGSFILEWMKKTGNENPFYEYFDDLVKICKKFDMALSLGDGMRPGCLHDSTDIAQITELKNLSIQARKCTKKEAKVMIEGPGHIPINEIETNVMVQKKMSGNVPFYVLGPLVTDIAPGYDHITGAIGGAIAASAGVDFLCYVTPAEHLGLPHFEEVKQGVIASKIAAHSADIVKRGEAARKRDDDFSEYRKNFLWKKQQKNAIDGKIFSKYMDVECSQNKACTLCGDFCAMKDKWED
ncbi:MAG: phosphomethylpyrimidine synthase ThiC [Candidatus Muiribacteriota bacterium]